MLENRPRRSRATRKLADDEEEQLKKVLALSKAEYEQTHSLPNSSIKRGLFNDNNNEPLTKKIKLKESLAPQKTNKMLAMSKQNKKDAITYSKKDNFTALSSKKSSKSQLKSSSSATQHRYFNRARTNAAPERSVLAGSTKANINLLDWCKEKSNEVIKDYAYYKICEESNEVKSDFGMVHLNVRDSKYTYLPGLEEISASYTQLSGAVDENENDNNDKEENNSENSRETEETEEIGDNNEVTLQTILSNRPPALKILDNFQSSIAQTTNTLVLSHLVGTSADRMNKITEYKKLICDCQTLDKEHKIQAAVNKKLKKILTELDIKF